MISVSHRFRAFKCFQSPLISLHVRCGSFCDGSEGCDVRLRHAHLFCMLVGFVGGASVVWGVGFEGCGGVRWRRSAAIGQLPGQRTSSVLLNIILGVLESWSPTQKENTNEWIIKPVTSSLHSSLWTFLSPARKSICMSSSCRMLWTHSFLMSTLAACNVSRSDEPRHNSTNLQGSPSTCSSMFR